MPQLLEWFKTAVPLGVAAIAAWTGYRYGLQRMRDERGFERRLAWYEATLAVTGALRESVIRAAIAERTRANLREDDGSWMERGSAAQAATAAAWHDVQERTAELPRALDRAVLNADAESEAAAAKASVVISSLTRWSTVLRNFDEGAGPTDEHPIRVTSEGAHSSLLTAALAELRAIDGAVIAGARAALGYPPRLPELTPNAEGGIVIPNRGTEQTSLLRRLLRRIGLARAHTSKFNP